MIDWIHEEAKHWGRPTQYLRLSLGNFGRGDGSGSN